MPPEWMWPFDEDLQIWFEAVDEKRKERFGITDDNSSSGPDGPTMKNEYAMGRGR